MSKYARGFLIAIITALGVTLAAGQGGHDCYLVLFVKGRILKLNSNQPIKKQDLICTEDSIYFEDADASARVFLINKGIFTIKQRSNRNQKNELFGVIKKFLSPVIGKLSTRGDGRLFEDEFGDSYLIINQARIDISFLKYPVSERDFFFIRYIYKDDTISKKLEVQNDSLILDSKIFLPLVDLSENIFINASLYYYSKNKGEFNRVHQFNIKLYQQVELQSELEILINELKTHNAESNLIKSTVETYLYESYGYVNRYDLNKWLSINFGVE